MTTEVDVVDEHVIVVVESTEYSVIPTETQTTVVAVGMQGPQGPQGIPGTPGAVGGAFTHIQGFPSAVWTITHNLSYRPGGVQVFDSVDREMLGDILHIDENSLTITFTAGFSGKAYLS